MNANRSHYIINTFSPVADATELNFKHFSVEEGMVGWVARNKFPFIGGVDTGPAAHHSIEGKLREFGIVSLLIVPMRAGNDLAGALCFGSTRENAYTEDDASIAQTYAMFLATAIKHVAVFDDVNRHLRQIELINEVAGQLTAVLDRDQLLSAAAAAIQKSFNYFDVTIFLISEDRKELVLEAHSGSFVDFLPHGYRQPVGQGILGWVATEDEVALVNDISEDPRYISYSYHNTRSELAVPIRIDKEIVGVLNVEDAKLGAFDATDAVVLDSLCDQLGSGLKNARLYDEVRRANMKLTELDKMKSEFLGIVSHDFRSPLSSIILASKALQRKEALQADQQTKDYLRLIIDQSQRLNQLAEDTLSITKIESGQLNYYFKIVNVERLVQDALALVRTSHVHLMEYEIDPDAIFIKGDQPKLRQVVQNLISNAVKYSPRGGKVCVIVKDYSLEEILVNVSDEGIGIPPEQMDRLFQKFSRVETGEARDIKGSGLGLWICREIVEAHGGRIWVESEPSKGSTFKFTLKKAH
jgi:K+-sensing histidine kinase KdpD